jgi:hypothetical protein
MDAEHSGWTPRMQTSSDPARLKLPMDSQRERTIAYSAREVARGSLCADNNAPPPRA